MGKIAALVVLLASSTALAQFEHNHRVYMEIERGGEVDTRLAYNFWSGEYPSPVINVSSTISGTTQIRAEKSLAYLGDEVSCTIRNEIIHPWSESESVKDFISLAPLQSYLVLRDFEATVSDLSSEPLIKAGSVLFDVVYLSEGVWSARAVINGQSRYVEIDFSQIEDERLLKSLSPKYAEDDPRGAIEQWLSLNCLEGYTAYIQDSELLKMPGVKPGRIITYGEVGP